MGSRSFIARVSVMAEDPFYDKDKVLEQYESNRKRVDNPNDTLEKPGFLELTGPLCGLDIVDLGCGNASFGREALEAGAKSYIGIEVSQKMVEIARLDLEGTNGQVENSSIEGWFPNKKQADVVTARLSLNYVENLEKVFKQAYTTLRSKGRFVISVEHPVISSNYAQIETGERTSWLVDNYFCSGARVHTWLGEEITKYHRTLEDWITLFTDNGFTIGSLRESRPVLANFQSEDEYERRLRIPLFLFIEGYK